MGLAPDTLTFDTGDPVRVATFWAAALGYDLVDPDPEGAYIADPSGQTRGIFFQPVPEPKTAKNRMHLDLHTADGQRDAEVERLIGLGATFLHDGRQGPYAWVTLADPEGNEFCVA